jgi:hypothetical protein
MERKIVGFLSRPTWFLIFLLIPILALGAAFAQTVGYAEIRDQINFGNRPVYFQLVICSQIFLSRWALFSMLLIMPYVLTYALFGLPGHEARVLPFWEFLRKTITEYWKHICFISLAIVTWWALGSIHNLSIVARDEIRFILMALVWMIVAYFLARRTPGGSDVAAAARIFSILILSLVDAIIVLLVVAKSWALGISAVASGGMWKDLSLLSLIYLILTMFSMLIVTRFSEVDATVERAAPLAYLMPVILSFAFVIIGIIVILFERNYTWSQLFIDDFNELHRTLSSEQSTALVGIARRFHNEHIIWRSVYCLFIGVVSTTIAAVLLKTFAHWAFTGKTKAE